MGLASDLLEQADHLARRDRTRPKQASLRRAISTAYYALFHLLVSEAVAYWKVARQRPLLARSFEHRKMKAACSTPQGANSDLRTVAAVFINLQQMRHLADYDYSTVFTRTEVLQRIDTVRQAFVHWQRVKGTDEAQDFLLAMIAPDRR